VQFAGQQQTDRPGADNYYASIHFPAFHDLARESPSSNYTFLVLDST
jgi:hypothetical protein